jgi:hypothetical protein
MGKFCAFMTRIAFFLVLIFGCGFGSLAHAQSVFVFAPLPTPPTSIPDFPCATKEQLDDLSKARARWEANYNAFEKARNGTVNAVQVQYLYKVTIKSSEWYNEQLRHWETRCAIPPGLFYLFPEENKSIYWGWTRNDIPVEPPYLPCMSAAENQKLRDLIEQGRLVSQWNLDAAEQYNRLVHEISLRKCDPPRTRVGCYPTLAGSSQPSVTLCSQAMAGVEFGGGSGKAKYEDETFNTSGVVAGAFVALRSYQPNNQMFGVQLSFLSTNMRASEINAGLNWAVPLDFQIGGVFQPTVGGVPVTAYAFVGPMWGQVRVKDTFSTEYFSMFGVSAGVGLEFQVSDQWSVGTRVRVYTLGPAERKAEGQQQSGVLWTLNAGYAFSPRF